MTHEQTIKLAIEAGFKFSPAQFSGVLEAEVKFAQLVAATAVTTEWKF